MLSDTVRLAIRRRAHNNIVAGARVVVVLACLFFANGGFSLIKYAYARGQRCILNAI